MALMNHSFYLLFNFCTFTLFDELAGFFPSRTRSYMQIHDGWPEDRVPIRRAS